MNKSTLIAIGVGIVVILVIIAGIGLMTSKPTPTPTATQAQTTTTQTTHTSQTTTTQTSQTSTTTQTTTQTTTTQSTSTQTSTTTTTTTTTQTTTSPIETETPPLIVNVTNFNLGIVTPNTGGSFTTPPILMTVNKGGNYTFYLMNTQQLGKLFSNFYVLLTLTNSTIYNTYSLGGLTSLNELTTNSKASVYLSPGTYELSIELIYAVHSIVSPTTFNGTFLGLGNSSVMYTVANVILNIQSQPKQVQLRTNPSIVNVTNFNLGKLTPNANGTVTKLINITINKGGYYSFYLVNSQELEKEFFGFYVIFSLVNSTSFEIHTMGWLTQFGPFYNNVTTYLSPGIYELNISVVYSVSNIVASTTFNGTFLGLGNSSVMYEAANVSFTIQTASSSSTQTSSSSVHMKTQPLNDTMVLASKERNLYILPKLI